MSMIVDCPPCASGDHSRHNAEWGIVPGLLGGSRCDCSGDCADRVSAAFADMFPPIVAAQPDDEVSRLTRERDLATEANRLAVERGNRLLAERDQARAENERLTAKFARVEKYLAKEERDYWRNPSGAWLVLGGEICKRLGIRSVRAGDLSRTPATHDKGDA